MGKASLPPIGRLLLEATTAVTAASDSFGLLVLCIFPTVLVALTIGIAVSIALTRVVAGSASAVEVPSAAHVPAHLRAHLFIVALSVY